MYLNENGIETPHVFLGGTCGEETSWDWRKELISNLECTFFDPFLRSWETDEEWDEAHQQKEIMMRQNANFSLYVITTDMKGFYSLCEAVDDSNKRPNQTVVCVVEDNEDVWSKEVKKSMEAFLNMVDRNGAVVCSSLDEVAAFLNESYELGLQLSTDDLF